MTFSILHISDLHRDPSQGIRNGPLLRSLLNDRGRYTTEAPEIVSPSLIVVSGDIVYGVPASHATPADALAAQYDEAEAFLVDLADAFLGGDRQRLILVPGNHDVSLPDTLASLAPVDLGTPRSLAEALADLFTPHSLHRWSWKDLTLFRLTDSDRYNRRVELYSALYSRFYHGARTYSIEPEEQFDLFPYPSLGIVIAAFNSCYNNDPLHRAGCIHPDAIAAAARKIDSVRFHGYVPIAVWHHNTAGGPHSDDYMDSDTLQVLIDCGFSIGLHGHQHKPTFVDERFRFGTGRKITVLSAGTLCGGHRSLPHGHDRSYNLIALDVEALSATVHQRRMVNESFASPIWSAGWFPESNASHITFPIQPPLVPHASINARLSEAESLIAKGDHATARDILLHITQSDDTARTLLLECYTTLSYDAAFITAMFPPHSLSEAVIVADALWELQDRPLLTKLLQSSIVGDSTDPVAIEIRQKYEARLR